MFWLIINFIVKKSEPRKHYFSNNANVNLTDKKYPNNESFDRTENRDFEIDGINYHHLQYPTFCISNKSPSSSHSMNNQFENSREMVTDIFSKILPRGFIMMCVNYFMWWYRCAHFLGFWGEVWLSYSELGWVRVW
jgi:hypothetical protein